MPSPMALGETGSRESSLLLSWRDPEEGAGLPLPLSAVLILHHASSSFAPWRADAPGKRLGHRPGMKHPFHGAGSQRLALLVTTMGEMFFISVCCEVWGDKREHGSLWQLRAFRSAAS